MSKKPDIDIEDIEDIDISSLHPYPLLVIDAAHHNLMGLTRCRVVADFITADQVVSSVTNIISTFLHHCEENKQSDAEEYIYGEIMKARETMAENTRVVQGEYYEDYED
jgi:hypothetical protein